MTDKGGKSKGRGARDTDLSDLRAATLTRADIAAAVYEAIPSQKRQMADRIVDSVFETISDSIARGEQVKLSGFGVFRIHEKKERAARNPATGAPATVSARKVVLFSASPLMKKALNQDAPARPRKRSKSSK